MSRTWWVGPGGNHSEHKAAKLAAQEAAARKAVSECKVTGHDPVNMTVRWIDGAIDVYRCCRCEARGYSA